MIRFVFSIFLVFTFSFGSNIVTDFSNKPFVPKYKILLKNGTIKWILVSF